MFFRTDHSLHTYAYANHNHREGQWEVNTRRNTKDCDTHLPWSVRALRCQSSPLPRIVHTRPVQARFRTDSVRVSCLYHASAVREMVKHYGTVLFGATDATTSTPRSGRPVVNTTSTHLRCTGFPSVVDARAALSSSHGHISVHLPSSKCLPQ